jgi:CMP-N-acetylneuraminic acid synthetase
VAAAEGFAPGFLRDPALADDHTPVVPVLQWVLARLAERGRRFDSVTLVMPTAPLITAEDLIAAHAVFDGHGGSRGVLAVAPFPVPVEWAFRRADDGTLTALQPGMDQVRSQDLPEAWYDSGTFLILPASCLRSDAPAPSWIGVPLERWKAVDIDTPADLALAERLFRAARLDA